MKLSRRALVALAIFSGGDVLSCSVVLADPPDGPLTTLRRTPAYQRSILTTVEGTSAYRAVACKDRKLALVGPLYTLDPPTFDKKGAVQTGDWAERIVVKGCGADRSMNVLVHVKGGTIESEPILPGSTNASLQLQIDSIGLAFDAARVDRKGCKPIYVLDTEMKGFFRQPDPSIKRDPWSEVWTIMQCDQRKIVTMTFMPDKTGTGINARGTP